MSWSRSFRVLLVLVLAIGFTAVGLPSHHEIARAAAGDAVTLDAPTLLHSSGAELHWSRFAGPSVFDRYEVHRGATAGFTPVSSGPGSTLLATIRDIDTTSWVDTSAAAATAFSYKVVVNGTDASNEQRVTLPADGLATLTLQPGPAVGEAAYMAYGSAITTTCYAYQNYGGATNLRIGSATNTVVHRPLLRFDLRRIPPAASVTSAKLTLWYGTNSAAPGEVDVYRATRAWDEGKAVYPGSCDGSGADWREARAGLAWSAAGGDFDAATRWAYVPATSHSSTGGSNAFTVTSLVQNWVNATTPNLGMLLKIANESIPSTTPQKYFDYYSDDYGTATQRPKLEVTYADGSHAARPAVSIAAPAANATVHGSVPITAAASDDGAVTRVDIAVDGSVLASDTSRPYTATWNSTTATNATHTITATAYDEAGHTASASTTVTADNTTAPTLSITSPGASDTVSGTVTVSATAGDDVGVTNVEFYADGQHLGDDSSAPYSMSWNTLDLLHTAFDDPSTPHTVTVKAYDGSGNVTASSVSVYVDNTSGTRYSAAFDLNAPGPADDYIPPVMPNSTTVSSTDTYSGGGRNLGSGPLAPTVAASSSTSSAAGTTTSSGGTTCPATSYCPTVTVTNTSSVAWKNSTGSVLRLWYRWYTIDGTILYEGPATDSFPSTVQPGASKTLAVVINPPALPTGIDLSLVRLRLDVYDTDADSAVPSPSWFSQHGNKPVDNPVLVTRDLDDALGLERYYGYQQTQLGGGMLGLVNVANGNLLAHWSPWSEPGRGLASVLGLTYNSLEDHSHSPAGNNWSLSLSTLTRFGEPLDVHPNQADTISGRSNKYIQFIDGDGTPHRFDGTTNPDGTTSWTAPPGVHLFLRSITTDQTAARYWALSRPDHVTFYYDHDGFPTAMVDKNGNTLSLTESDVPAGEDPGGPKKRVTAVTDAGGRAVQVGYYSKDEAKSPHIRGNIRDITDHGGHVLHFDYYEDGNLLRITQRGGTTASGAFLADRSWVFTYTTSAGDGPAIPTAADRGTNPGTPDPRTPNQSTRLFSVRDPNGRESTFAYYGPGSSNLLRWKVHTLTDRAVKTTTYGYDPSTRQTTITDPLGHNTVYGYDTDGKPTSTTNAKNETTSMSWNGDFMLAQVTEPNTAAHTDYTYNANGYLTSVTDQEGGQTALTYEDRPLDATDTGTHWSLLATKTSPRGTATTAAGDFTWTFGYDTGGNLTSATAPGQTMAAIYAYDSFGQLIRATSPNGGDTTYTNYDANGLPQQVTYPVGRVTLAGFDADGQQLWTQTPAHSGATGADVRSYRTYFDYDAFHRLGRQSQPKSTTAARGLLVWTTISYDPNDNVTAQRNPVYGRDDPGSGAQTTYSYDAMDRRTLSTSPDTSADPAGARTSYDYDAAGNLTAITAPNSMKAGGANPNPTLVNTYDVVNRAVSRKVNAIDPTTGAVTGSRTSYTCYDTVGNIAAVYQPLAGLTAPPATCPAATTANAAAHTTLYGYDLAHRLTSTIEPLASAGATARTVATHYYPDGTVKDRVDEAGKTTRYDYDQRGLLSRVDAPFTATRSLTTLYEYDPDGNRTRVVGARAYDASPDKATFTDFVTRYTYDAADQLAVVTLPTGTASNGSATPAAFAYRTYDADGRLATTSLPVSTPPSTTDPTRPSSTLNAPALTTVSYWDPGWVHTQKTGANPPVRFDHTAEGWQLERSPDTGTAQPSKTEIWSYFPTGNIRSRSDPEGHSERFTYDPDSHLTQAVDNIGVIDPTQSTVTVTAAYDGYGEVSKSTSKLGSQSFDTYSTYTYTADGQIATRQDNGKEGGTTAAPDRVSLVYDGADWLTGQYDFGTGTTCANDQHVTTSYLPTGWESRRVMARMAGTCSGAETTTASSYPTKQTTNWTYTDNGRISTLNVLDGAGHVLQTHSVGYDDPAGVYNDGFRTSDKFSLNGSGSTQCTGSTPTCTASYVYDARDKLISSNDGHGTQTTYTLDGNPSGCTTADPTIRAGNVTTEAKSSGATVTRCYSGNQQSTQIDPSGTTKYWYDDLGRLLCVTTTAVTSRDECSHSDGAAADGNLRQVNTYDYLDHLITTRRYNSSGTKTDSASYVYDALDRTATEKESHNTGSVTTRTTTFTYLALSKQSVNDHQSTTANCSGVQTSLTADKSYLYDAYGHRVSMGDRSASCAATTQPASPTMYDYGQDVHGSVGTLNKDGNTSGSASAVYSYTPYGQEDDQADQAKSLSKGDVLQSGTAVNGTTRNDNPLNPFRYSSKRYDTGSQTLDTGARRFDLGSGRFLQPDVFRGALDDLGLGTDPLNQNRYALAAANPVGYAESDGHMLIDGGGGGGASSAPTASPTAGSPAAFRLADQTTDYVPASPAPDPPPPPKHHWWDSVLGGLEDAGRTIGKGTVNFVGSTGAGLVNGLTKTVTLGMYDPKLSGCAFDEAGALHDVCTAGHITGEVGSVVLLTAATGGLGDTALAARGAAELGGAAELARTASGAEEIGRAANAARAAETSIPDEAVVVRGGTGDVPPAGQTFSGSYGSSFEEAARGVPHGQVRQATAGEIRAGGGSVDYAPEYDARVGRTNYQHVDVCLGPGECPFGDLEPNPWPRKARWGGPDYPYADEP